MAREARDMRETRDVEKGIFALSHPVHFSYKSRLSRYSRMSRKQGPMRGELPGSETTGIEVDELSAWIKPYPAIAQLQCGMTDFPELDTRNIEVDRLSLNMQAVLRNASAPLHKQRIILRRPISGNHMDLTGATNRFVYEIHMLQQLRIDRGYFSCVMATQNMIHFIQRRKVIVPCIIPIADSQPLVRMHVEKGKFRVRKLARTCDRGKK